MSIHKRLSHVADSAVSTLALAADDGDGVAILALQDRLTELGVRMPRLETTWTMQDGADIPIVKMGIQHLQNTIAMLKRNMAIMSEIADRDEWEFLTDSDVEYINEDRQLHIEAMERELRRRGVK